MRQLPDSTAKDCPPFGGLAVIQSRDRKRSLTDFMTFGGLCRFEEWRTASAQPASAIVHPLSHNRDSLDANTMEWLARRWTCFERARRKSRVLVSIEYRSIEVVHSLAGTPFRIPFAEVVTYHMPASRDVFMQLHIIRKQYRRWGADRSFSHLRTNGSMRATIVCLSST